MSTTNPTFNYTQHAWEGQNYQANRYLSYAEIAKKIREELKHRFPSCKFSITKESYSGGGSINVALMEAPFQVYRTPSEELLTPQNLSYYTVEETMKQWERMISEGYHQINNYYVNEDFYLTSQAKGLMTDVISLVNSYNFDDSDSQCDYFHTNFYSHFSIGKYEKPFKQLTK